MPTFPVIRSDQYPATDETQCVKVYIPLGDEYKALLAGLLTLASNVQNYDDPLSAQADGLAAAWDTAFTQTDWEGCMSQEQIFSSRLVLWGLEMGIVAGGSFGWSSHDSQFLNGYWGQGAGALNDEVEGHFAAPEGIYRLDFFGLKLNSGGQQLVTVNGVPAGAVVDWYNSSTSLNQLVQMGYDFELHGDEGLTINSKVTGKNASSSGYRLLLTTMKIRRLGDV